MGKVRSAAVAVVIATLIAAGGTPAYAADPAPLAITATGLTEGQSVGLQYYFHPVWTGGADVTEAQVYVDGKLGFSATSWPRGLRVNTGNVADGAEILVTVRLYDSTGAFSEASTHVFADKTLPTASFSPVSGSAVPVSGLLTVTASDVSDDVAEIDLEDFTGAKLASATAAPWTLAYNTVGGPYRLVLRVTDRAGNQRQYAGYTVDNQPPTIGDLDFFGRPVGRVHGYTQINAPFYEGVSHYEWRVDGVLADSWTAPQSPAWVETADGAMLSYDFGTTQRTVNLQLLASDPAGNESIRTFTVFVDSTGPSVTAVTPAYWTLVRGSTFTSTIRAVDASGVADAVLDSAFWANDPNNLTVRVPAGADGVKPLVWRVYDRFDNMSTVTRYVIVDNTRPLLAITSAPKNGARVKGTVKVSAAAWDRNGINRVELLINGKLVARDVTAGYAFTINTAKYGTTIRVQLRTYDRAGNVTVTTTRTWHR